MASFCGVDARSSLVQAFAASTTMFVARALGRAASGRPVIISLGNNDAGGGDYRIDPVCSAAVMVSVVSPPPRSKPSCGA